MRPMMPRPRRYRDVRDQDYNLCILLLSVLMDLTEMFVNSYQFVLAFIQHSRFRMLSRTRNAWFKSVDTSSRWSSMVSPKHCSLSTLWFVAALWLTVVRINIPVVVVWLRFSRSIIAWLIFKSVVMFYVIWALPNWKNFFFARLLNKRAKKQNKLCFLKHCCVNIRACAVIMSNLCLLRSNFQINY